MSPRPFDKAQGKRILIFSLAYSPIEGGAEIAVKEITDRISDTRLNDTVGQVEFDIVTMRFDKAHPKKEKIRNCTIYRINGGLGYLSKILFVPHAALFALKLNRKKHYDALWAIMTNMLFPITLMRFIGNHTPYILTLQDGDPFEYVFERLRIRIFMPLLKYGFRHASIIQTISNFLAKWPVMFGYRGKVEVIPNGVDVRRFSNVKSLAFDNRGGITLITTSRLVEKNAVGDIIGALKFLPGNVSLKIIGVGPLEAKLRKQVQDLDLKTRVEFLGYISHFDISKYLHGADIFVRPSLSEGMGNSFIEAMAAGLPIIGTPVGGIPDFLKDPSNSSGQVATGLFCEPENPESIAKAVKRLMENPDLRKRLIENGQKLAREKYDWDLIAQEMKIRVFDPAMAGQVR